MREWRRPFIRRSEMADNIDRDTHDHDLTYENEQSMVTIPLIEELLQDIRELRNEMVQKNWPAQRLSNIILKYEMKLK